MTRCISDGLNELYILALLHRNRGAVETEMIYSRLPFSSSGVIFVLVSVALAKLTVVLDLDFVF
jgi:hypothetical protein